MQRLAERFCIAPLPDGVKADPCARNPHHPNRTGTNLLTLGELCEALSLAADLGINPKDAVSLYLDAMTMQVAA